MYGDGVKLYKDYLKMGGDLSISGFVNRIKKGIPLYGEIEKKYGSIKDNSDKYKKAKIEYMREYIYQKRNKSAQKKYIDGIIKLPGRCIDETKYFTKQDYDYIKSVAI